MAAKQTIKVEGVTLAIYEKSITVDGVCIYTGDPLDVIATRLETIIRNVRAQAQSEVKSQIRALIGARA